MAENVTYEQFDIVGKPILVGDYVAADYDGQLRIALVLKLTEKMVKVKPVKGFARKVFYAYADQCVLIDNADALVHILKG